MSESLDGVSCNVTRQNAGNVLNAALAFVAPGGMKSPAGTDSDDNTRPAATVVCSKASHASGAAPAIEPAADDDAEPSRITIAAILM